MGFVIKKSITYNMMDGNQLEYVFDNINLDHITFKGNGKESFSFNRALVENLILCRIYTLIITGLRFIPVIA